MSNNNPGDDWTGDYTGRREKADDTGEATTTARAEEPDPMTSSQSSEPAAQTAPATAAATGEDTADSDQSARVAGAAAAAAMAAPDAPADAAAAKPAKTKHAWYVRLVGCVIWLYEHLPQALIALLARVAIGLVFWMSGRTKVTGIFDIKDSTFFLFKEEYKMPITISLGDTHFTVPFTDPVTAAYIATAAEHLFPLLLWIGFCTRFAATGLLIMTCVIAFWVYPDKGLATWVLHGLWATVLLYLMRWGPGMFSIDHILRRKFMDN